MTLGFKDVDVGDFLRTKEQFWMKWVRKEKEVNHLYGNGALVYSFIEKSDLFYVLDKFVQKKEGVWAGTGEKAISNILVFKVLDFKKMRICYVGYSIAHKSIKVSAE